MSISSSDIGVGVVAYAVTPSDTVNLAETARALYVGNAGNISVFQTNGASVTYMNFPAGKYLLSRVVRVNATGTTASNILAIL